MPYICLECGSITWIEFWSASVRKTIDRSCEEEEIECNEETFDYALCDECDGTRLLRFWVANEKESIRIGTTLKKLEGMERVAFVLAEALNGNIHIDGIERSGSIEREIGSKKEILKLAKELGIEERDLVKYMV